MRGLSREQRSFPEKQYSLVSGTPPRPPRVSAGANSNASVVEFFAHLSHAPRDEDRAFVLLVDRCQMRAMVVLRLPLWRVGNGGFVPREGLAIQFVANLKGGRCDVHYCTVVFEGQRAIK